jgi:hypothetical protein
MHAQARAFTEFVKRILPAAFHGKTVVDIGAGDINGNNRFLFTDCEYQGNDVAAGPNVTVVCPPKALSFADGHFDTVISTECFEHDPQYAASFQKIARMLRPGGLFAFTCASTGRPEHGTRRTSPKDSLGAHHNVGEWTDHYRNLSIEDVAECIDLDALFSEWRSFYNAHAKDLYFVGIRRLSDSAAPADTAAGTTTSLPCYSAAGVTETTTSGSSAARVVAETTTGTKRMCIVQPRLVLLVEIAQGLMEAMQRCGICAEWVAEGHDPIDGLETLVVLDYQNFAPTRSRPYVFVNLEQSSSFFYESDIQPHVDHATETWDFSPLRVAHMRERANRVMFLPIPFPGVQHMPTTVTQPASALQAPLVSQVGQVGEHRPRQVVFMGWTTGSLRRQEALSALVEAGLRVTVVNPGAHSGAVLVGPARFALMREAAVVINVHYHMPSLQETHRIMQALQAGACVVSERSSDPTADMLCAGEAVTFVDEGDWAALAAEVSRVLHQRSDPVHEARMLQHARRGAADHCARLDAALWQRFEGQQ